MVLESTMICVDDSDYMRNGDFVPTRLAAAQDAVNMVSVTKTRANPENNVGLLTMASNEVLTTLTTDVSKIMSKLLAVTPQGELKLMSGLRVAHLALKHRQGKNHKMRIIAFIGSPLDGLDKTEFVRLAKRLKKEKVNVDIVYFGDIAVTGEEAKNDPLNQFIDALNGKDGTSSHLVVVPPGANLTEVICHSPILASEDGAPAPGMPGGGYDFGMEADDPELALALRVSMEEQRARQEAEARANNPDAGTEGSTNEEQMLEQALAMSMDARPGAAGRVPDFSAMSEEEQIEYAMQMSMQEHATPAAGSSAPAAAPSATPKTEPVKEEAMDVDDPTSEGADPEFLQQVLEGLPADNKPDTPGSKPAVKSEKKSDPKSGPKKK